MPKTLKSVSKGYSSNLNYSLSPRRFESIIKVLENSRDNLSKAHVAHIVLQVDDEKFNKSLINEALKQVLEKKLETGYGYFIAMEKSEYSGFHIHIMLTFSTGLRRSFTILNEARNSLYALDNVKTAIALPRWKKRSVSIDTEDYYTAFKTINNDSKYFHDLNIPTELADAVQRYSYLAKNETKEEIEVSRLTQSKYPKAYKTKVGQKIRKIKEINNV
jgi:hypothetical protein